MSHIRNPLDGVYFEKYTQMVNENEIFSSRKNYRVYLNVSLKLWNGNMSFQFSYEATNYSYIEFPAKCFYSSLEMAFWAFKPKNHIYRNGSKKRYCEAKILIRYIKAQRRVVDTRNNIIRKLNVNL